MTDPFNTYALESKTDASAMLYNNGTVPGSPGGPGCPGLLSPLLPLTPRRPVSPKKVPHYAIKIRTQSLMRLHLISPLTPRGPWMPGGPG